jgi:hypothetical protein
MFGEHRLMTPLNGLLGFDAILQRMNSPKLIDTVLLILKINSL